MGLLRTRSRAVRVAPFSLDATVCRFHTSKKKHLPWTIRDACAGTQIFGGIGSGKTSGSGQTIAKSMLRAGFGGLVLTAKPDERATWERYARETGRADSLLIISPESGHGFNFLEYELKRPGGGAGLTENLVQLFTTVLEVGDRQQGGSNEKYWDQALRQLLRNAIDLAAIGSGTVTLPTIGEIILSAPQTPAQVVDPKWQAGSKCFQMVVAGEAKDLPPATARDFAIAAGYWLKEFPAISDRTRSIVVNMFTGLADVLMRGVLFDLFCNRTTFVPELTHEGAIIVLDLPIKEFNEVGQFAQVLFKSIWQRAAERRAVDPQTTRSIFLWVDEAQYFVTSQDMLFQTTARSAKVATVLLTQSISNYYEALDGGTGTARTEGLVSNLSTKIFHANSGATNDWAQNLFAQEWQSHTGTSSSAESGSGGSGAAQASSSRSESLDPVVLSREFIGLANGGPANGGIVEGILFAPNLLQKHKASYLRVSFAQGI